jgi:hypothetical protein
MKQHSTMLKELSTILNKFRLLQIINIAIILKDILV